MEAKDITIFNLETRDDAGPLRASFSMILEGWLIIHGVGYLEKGNSRFISLPGRKTYAVAPARPVRIPVIECVDGDTHRRFEHVVLQALDALAAPAQEDPSIALAAGQDEIPGIR
jgi:DNA-binding cell septation regulator SpoVG